MTRPINDVPSCRGVHDDTHGSKGAIRGRDTHAKDRGRDTHARDRGGDHGNIRGRDGTGDGEDGEASIRESPSPDYCVSDHDESDGGLVGYPVRAEVRAILN